MERRAVLELRAHPEKRLLEGYAAKFGIEARISDFTEVVSPGAFTTTLAENRDILALVDHDTGKLLARTKTGTLELVEDSTGLRFKIKVPKTGLGDDILELASRGDLGGASFGFIAKEDRWQGKTRSLLKVDLKEISVVQSWPAYPETEVTARSKTPRLNRAKLILRMIS